MSDFWDMLINPLFPFIRNAVAAALLSSILFGVLGSIVTVRRIASLAGAISHAVLGGIGLSLYLQSKKIPMPPLAGALLFALAAAFVIAFVSYNVKEREDTIINALWAIGMSVGVFFIAQTPGYKDPSSYLFGSILLIAQSDLILLGILDIVVVFLVWRFYPQLLASSFDEEFAKARGVNVKALFVIILIVSAVAVVLLQGFVGIIMVIAMLTLPQGSAGTFATSLASMMILSSLFSAVFSVIGILISWACNTPVGATTVIIAALAFLLTLTFQSTHSHT